MFSTLFLTNNCLYSTLFLTNVNPFFTFFLTNVGLYSTLFLTNALLHLRYVSRSAINDSSFNTPFHPSIFLHFLKNILFPFLFFFLFCNFALSFMWKEKSIPKNHNF